MSLTIFYTDSNRRFHEVEQRFMDTHNKLAKFARGNNHVQESLKIIEEALIKYKLEDICISFNGGKDCTVLLHLLSSFFPSGQKILAFYAQLPEHFEEESLFVNQTVQRYNLKLMQYSTTSLKQSLFQLKSDLPNIQAIFVGTRSDDLKPNHHLDVFAPTDKDWPQLMRINPILKWSYSQVWQFIRELDIPHCDLYNQGYSSLGTKNDTRKNSSLLRYNSRGEPYYLPAWHLTKTSEERLNRSLSMDVTNKDSTMNQ